jgi:hypothetical protein
LHQQAEYKYEIVPVQAGYIHLFGQSKYDEYGYRENAAQGLFVTESKELTQEIHRGGLSDKNM